MGVTESQKKLSEKESKGGCVWGGKFLQVLILAGFSLGILISALIFTVYEYKRYCRECEKEEAEYERRKKEIEEVYEKKRQIEALADVLKEKSNYDGDNDTGYRS